MNPLLNEIRRNALLWLLGFVPVVFAAQKLMPEAHTLLFVLSVLAIVPLAALLSHATESVATKTGDAVGGLLNATLGNLTELVIALAALRAGQYTLVKASIAGAIVTNTLFMLGASFLLGGLKHHVQEYNRASARLQAGLLFLATIAMLIPSTVSEADSAAGSALTAELSVSLSVLLIAAYGLGLIFSLKTHRELFDGAEPAETGEVALGLGPGHADRRHGTGRAGERGVRRVGAASSDGVRDDSRVRGFHRRGAGGRCGGDGISVFCRAQESAGPECGHSAGQQSQIALFVTPILVFFSYVIGPVPLSLQFWPGAVVMMLIATMTASLVTNSGQSTWFVGVLVLMVYLIFAMTLYLLPPRLQ
jgi:Ca2+:H+ antiporter